MGQKIAGGMKRQRLSPLLPVEQAVAMRHYQMIDRYIAQQALPKDEYYDVVAFGFLLAVKSPGLVPVRIFHHRLGVHAVGRLQRKAEAGPQN